MPSDPLQRAIDEIEYVSANSPRAGSRSSTHDVDSALTPPISSLSLETLARLARAATPMFEKFGDLYGGMTTAGIEFHQQCTPERILGLIAAAQQQQKQNDEGKTEKSEAAPPSQLESSPSRDATSRLAWLDDRMQRSDTAAWRAIGLSPGHTSLWDAIGDAMDAEGVP